MSHQLESRHFFRARDAVQRRDGREGEVVEAWALYARIRWEGGGEEEVDQFDPRIVVLQRSAPE